MEGITDRIRKVEGIMEGIIEDMEGVIEDMEGITECVKA